MKLTFSAVFLFVALTASLGLTQNAFAQISVEQVILRFKQSDPPVRNLTVRNSADRAMLVVVQPTVVENPGSLDEKRENTEDILVSPKRFSIDGKGERTVRILVKKPRGDLEQVYRVAFAPEAREDDEGVKVPQAEKFKGMVRILTGVGILVFVDPKDPKPELITERRAKDFYLKNTGNTNLLIDKLRRCAAPNLNCTDYTTRRLYPGNELLVDAKDSTSLYFKKRYFDENEELEIK